MARFRQVLGDFPVDAAEAVVRRTSAFGRDHAGADGGRRGAGGAEDRALPRLDVAGEHRSAFAGHGVWDPAPRHLETALGVECCVFLRDAEAGVFNPAETAPLEGVAEGKDAVHKFLRGGVAGGAHNARVLVVHPRLTGSNVAADELI